MQNFATNLYLEETDFRLMSVDFGNRMTVIDLPDGNLWLHSVVPLTPGLKAKLDQLGQVKYLIVPNVAHNLFVDQYQEAYPEAVVYAPKGTKKVRRDYTLKPENTAEYQNHWSSEIAVLPVAGLALMNEYAFFHHRSGTLILTDLAFNIDERVGPWSRFVFKLYGAFGHFGPTRLTKLLIRDKSAFSLSLAELEKLNIAKIVISHGKCLQNGAKQALLEAFSGN